MDWEPFLFLTLMFFGCMDVPVNVGFPSPSHPFVIALNSQVLGAIGWLSSWLLSTAPWEFILQSRFLQKMRNGHCLRLNILQRARFSPVSSLMNKLRCSRGVLPVAVPHRSHFVEAHISGGGGMSLEGRDLPQDPFSGKG